MLRSALINWPLLLVGVAIGLLAGEQIARSSFCQKLECKDIQAHGSWDGEDLLCVGYFTSALGTKQFRDCSACTDKPGGAYCDRVDTNFTCEQTKPSQAVFFGACGANCSLLCTDQSKNVKQEASCGGPNLPINEGFRAECQPVGSPK